MAEVKSAKQKIEEAKAKLEAEAENVPGWHRKLQEEDCGGCDEKKKTPQKKKEERQPEGD